MYAIFVSYAANLVVPRVGEISRCGMLSKYDGISFSKSLGTVVTERLIDTMCVLLITVVTLIMQASVFDIFLKETGTDTMVFTGIYFRQFLYHHRLCAVRIGRAGVFPGPQFNGIPEGDGILNDVWAGCLSLRHVKHPWLFAFYTVGIWVCYFLQFYVSFYCFDFSASLGWMPGLVMFVVGSIAVAVTPTPNGAETWHFAVITMMMMYGVGKEDAGIFALLVHGIQTFLLILLGVYGLVALPLVNKKRTGK